MPVFIRFSVGLLITVLLACETGTKKNSVREVVPSEAVSASKDTLKSREKLLLEETISAHGGILYEDAYYEFAFRDKKYTFRNDSGRYHYTVSFAEEGDVILDSLSNGKFRRYRNGMETKLTNKDIAKYSEALNSVVYFATLPHKLTDQAVIKSYEGSVRIEERTYAVLGVSFQRVGGGTDFDDKFHYWINQQSKTVDFLAYSYNTNGGGVRFRKAYNPRNVGGIRFQDYINYEAPIGTPLTTLPSLYEQGHLKELSRIITEDVRNLKER